ncbi:MAG TPA: hypothetical protein VGA02_06860 [Gemmatimonadales bacterium]|jgi:hypothetical protein
MRQYDVVVLRLTTRARSDEEALADLLNERARGGWLFHSITALAPTRAVVVFSRDAA